MLLSLSLSLFLSLSSVGARYEIAALIADPVIARGPTWRHRALSSSGKAHEPRSSEAPYRLLIACRHRAALGG